MKESTATIADVQKSYGDLLRRVQPGGERITITRRGKPIAALVPFSDLEQLEGESAMDTDQNTSPQQSQDAATTELGLRALQLSGGEFDAAMALLNRAAVALFTEKERQRRTAKQAAKDGPE